MQFLTIRNCSKVLQTNLHSGNTSRDGYCDINADFDRSTQGILFNFMKIYSTHNSSIMIVLQFHQTNMNAALVARNSSETSANSTFQCN